MKKETRCIICGKELNGLEVKEDYVINAMRWFKRNVTHNEKNYRLVVCKDCYVKYKKARNSYNSKTVSYLAIGVIFAALLVITGRSLGALAAGIAIIMLMYALSLLSYMPGLKQQSKGASKGTEQQI
jgi:cytochrome b subunit of formate dehydrogenase